MTMSEKPVTVSYTPDYFIVRDKKTKQQLDRIPYSVYEKMHELVTNMETGPTIKRQHREATRGK